MEQMKDPFEAFIQSAKEANQLQAPISYKGMRFSFYKPPYFEIQDHIEAKNRIIEAYNFKEMLFLHGYSGAGKTTILRQLSNQVPNQFIYISPVSKLTNTELVRSIAQALTGKEYFGRLRIKDLKQLLSPYQSTMLLFDEVTVEMPEDRRKLETLKSLYDETGLPMILTGINYTYAYLMQENHDKYFSSLKTRLRDQPITGMSLSDAYNYLQFLEETENIKFSYIAIQALADTALNRNAGGIHALVTILGKCITHARIRYYMDDNHNIPPSALYSNSEEDSSYGARKVVTLPKTNGIIEIDEYQVLEEQEHYRTNFPKIQH